MSSRRFDWISSSRGDPALLARLQERMDRFYRRPDVRDAYQKYIDKREVESFDHPFERQVAEYLAGLRPAAALEVGCGNGRFFRTLQRAGFAGKYVGSEVAGWIVQGCSRRHPEAGWIAATGYQIPVRDRSFDVCFSYGVIESLVYPERALEEMLRVLKRGGRLVLLFPDFVESGRFGSQLTGLSPGRPTRKLERGRWIDAALTYYDQKFRLPRALRRSRHRIGPFPVNLAPVALDHPADTSPDYDAVYLSSKADIEEWASAKGLPIECPLGRRLPKALRARSWAFLVIKNS
jgi:SAM-dependent methyltransferase